MSAASESDTAANSAALDLIEFLFLPWFGIVILPVSSLPAS